MAAVSFFALKVIEKLIEVTMQKRLPHKIIF